MLRVLRVRNLVKYIID